jgi:hypothetical protein
MRRLVRVVLPAPVRVRAGTLGAPWRVGSGFWVEYDQFMQSRPPVRDTPAGKSMLPAYTPLPQT